MGWALRQLQAGLLGDLGIVQRGKRTEKDTVGTAALLWELPFGGGRVFLGSRHERTRKKCSNLCQGGTKWEPERKQNSK